MDGPRLGDLVQATHGFKTHEHPVFSPDGRRIAFYGGVHGAFRILVTGIDGWGERPITCGRGNQTQPAWSPDGRFLYYRAQTSDAAPWAVWRSSVEDPDERACLLADARTSFKHPSPSPDGRWLAWFSDEGSPGVFHLWKAPLRGPRDARLGPRVRLTSDPGRNDCHPVWSPDGRRLAFHAYMGTKEASESHVFACDADGSGVRQLTTRRGALHKHPFFVGRDLLVHHAEAPEAGRWIEVRRASDGEPLGRLTDGTKNDKHPSPHVPARGPVRIAFASKKRGREWPDERDRTYDVFWGTLQGLRVPR